MTNRRGWRGSTASFKAPARSRHRTSATSSPAWSAPNWASKEDIPMRSLSRHSWTALVAAWIALVVLSNLNIGRLWSSARNVEEAGGFLARLEDLRDRLDRLQVADDSAA